MPQSDRVLFLSLRPHFADLIMTGVKTVELRRHRPRTAPGTLVLLYASSPERQLVGTCVIDEIGEATPSDLWQLYGPHTGIDLGYFSDYFSGTQRGIAIRLKAPQRLLAPMALEDLRVHLPAFMPPRSFRYLSTGDARQLLRDNREP